MVNLVLDLDETLIHTVEVTKKFSNQLSKAVDFYFRIEDQWYWVVKRPGLDLFLDFVFKYFKVGIWTAGDKEYAKHICKNILSYSQLKQIQFIYSRNFCHLEQNPPAFSKPLNKLFDLYPELNEKNTVMLDNNLNVMKYNQHIGINIPDFINQYNDGMLYHIRNVVIKFYQRNNMNTSSHILAKEVNNYLKTIKD